MVQLDSLASRLAFAAAVVDRHPAQLDPEKIQDVALALGRMTPAQRELLTTLASHGHDALYSELTTVQHIVNDIRRARVDKSGGTYVEAFLRPDDLVRGLRFHQVQQGVGALDADGRRDLVAALEAKDGARTAQFLDGFGLGSKGGGADWVTRVFSAFPQGDVVRIEGRGAMSAVEIRGAPAERIARLEAQLEETLARAGDDPARLSRAADLFAALLDASATASKRTKKPNLAAWFQRLGAAGAPGFLPERAPVSHDVPLIGGAVTTLHHFSPEQQAVGFELQLGRRGGLDYTRPNGSVVIKVGDDERYLGRPGAPLGIDTGDHIVVPARVEAVIVEQPSFGSPRQLGALELPSGPFTFRTRHSGRALRLPKQVMVGDAKFELREGTYRSSAPSAEVVPGQPIVLRAGGVERRVDPKTGEVQG